MQSIFPENDDKPEIEVCHGDCIDEIYGKCPEFETCEVRGLVV